MELTVIRHLPTEWNKKGVLQGKRDISISDITPEYLRKMTENKQKLCDFSPFDSILTSTLKRTIETASKYGFQYIVKEPLADELDFGDFEGKPKQLLIKIHEEEWLKNPISLNLGEELSYFQKRLFKFLDKYKNHSSILLFGHGSWIRGLASIHKCGTIADMNKISVNNNALLHFSFPPEQIKDLLIKRGNPAKVGGFQIE